MNRFLKPDYASRCFSNIPSTIAHLLTGRGASSIPLDPKFSRRYDSVVLILVDAFGWRFFEKYCDSYPFLKRFAQEGSVLKLTSQFPSTTAAHITTLHTNLPVGQSGVFEWQYYEPSLDAMIMPLMFSFVGARERETLRQAKADPKLLYPQTTFYDSLNAQGIASYIFQHRDYTPSSYSDAIFRGATEVRRIHTWSETLINLQLRYEKRATPSYFYSYFSNIDSIGHEYGANSPQFEAEVDTFLNTMERLWFQRSRRKYKNTLLIVTADHGLADVDPATTIYFNVDPRFAGYEKFLQRTRAGQFKIPAGSPRDYFLYVKPDRLDEAREFFAQRFQGKADVRKVSEMIDEGYFGPRISDEFLARVGNLVILPYQNETVWWYEKDKFEQRYFGHHGGLSKEEMEIPLLMLEL
jgi:hypothetical protein